MSAGEQVGAGDQATDFADVVAGVLGLGRSDIADEDGPATVGRWTSRKHLELVVKLEQFYGVTFGYDEILAMQSFGDLREGLRRKGAPC